MAEDGTDKLLKPKNFLVGQSSSHYLCIKNDTQNSEELGSGQTACWGPGRRRVEQKSVSTFQASKGGGGGGGTRRFNRQEIIKQVH